MINEAIRNRRSIRRYKNTGISREDIEQIIEAGGLAPSGKNRQPWKFLVYGGEKKKELLLQMERGIRREIEGASMLPESGYGLPDAKNTLRIMQEAPILIMVVNPEGKSPFEALTADERFTELVDTLSIGAAIENMILQAEESGIGTLWVGNTCFAYLELAEYIGVPGQLVGAVVLGIADEKPLPRPRKKMELIAEYRI